MHWSTVAWSNWSMPMNITTFILPPRLVPVPQRAIVVTRTTGFGSLSILSNSSSRLDCGVSPSWKYQDVSPAALTNSRSSCIPFLLSKYASELFPIFCR